MTKEEILQKVNDYCTEKQYTNETLTDDFKDKFAGFFLDKYKESESGLDDEKVLADLKFNLNTAFSATSKGVTSKQQAFSAKEAEYKRQIEELNKKLGSIAQPDGVEQSISKELQEKLDELERFKDEQRKSDMYKSILAKAKESVREDLHKSLENYAKDFSVKLEETSDVQAVKLVSRFQEIFKDSIGNVKPLTPQVNEKRDEELLSSIPKVKI